MSEQKFYITPTGNEIIVRDGKAVDQLPLKEPVKIAVSGDIHSISAYISARVNGGFDLQAVDASKAIVTADKEAGTIVLQLDPQNYYGTTITGKLESSKEIDQFFINKDKTFTREGLLKLVRFSRLYFDDKDIHGKMVLGLTKIELKTETEMKAANDRQGNKMGSIDQKVNMPDTWIKEFTLLVPVFNGFPPEKIRVEICIDVTASGFSFWLESPELAEVMDGAVDKIFKDELECCKDFVIINK